MKRILAVLILVLFLTGCGAAEKKEENQVAPVVTLRYYTIGRVDPDLSLVNEKLNELMISRYGFGVDYQKLDWNEYENTVNEIINSNQNFDVMFTWDSHYLSHASQGAFLDLTEFLNDQGSDLKNAVDSRLWQGVKVDGKICGVPTNKELAPVVQFLFSKELVEKYDIKTANFRTISSLEPLLAMIHREEPDVQPLLFTSEQTDLAQMIGYEYAAGRKLPFVVKLGDPECRILNLYETEEMKELQSTLRRFYQKGYINQDAALRTAISRFSDEQVFCRIGSGGPDSARSFSVDFGYPIVTMAASTPWVTNTSAQGGIMAVNAKTPYQEEALTFLTAVNLDPEVRNLLNYGISGVHYSLTDNDQVHVLSDRYRGVPYTQGNWFILKTMEGEEKDKWKNYQIYNDQAKSSCLLGFEPDLRQFTQAVNQVSQVYLRYDNALLTGSVDPDEYRAKALTQMTLAGEETVRRELQRQVDHWLESNHASMEK